MSARGVGHDDMMYDLIDDSIAEALLDSTLADPRFAALSAALDEMRVAGEGEAPAPTAELAALLDGRSEPRLVARRRTRALRVAGGIGLAAKLALGAGAAAAAVGGAGAAGVLPGPVVHFIDDLGHSITPGDGHGSSEQAPGVGAGDHPSTPAEQRAADASASESTEDGVGSTPTEGTNQPTTTGGQPSTNAGQPSSNADDKKANSEDKGTNAGQPSPNAADQSANASPTGQAAAESSSADGQGSTNGQGDANGQGSAYGQGSANANANGQGNGRGNSGGS